MNAQAADNIEVGAVPGLVSVIIPVFNRAGMLREAVGSVTEQNYSDIEIIVVDDGSTDDTPGAIDALAGDIGPALKTMRIDNGGPGVAREAGRRVARGEFIQYLDSDDLLLPGKFTDQVAALNRHPRCGIAHGMTVFQVVGEPLELRPHKGTGQGHERLFPALLAERWWSTSTPLYRRTVTDAVGPWLPLRNEEDWEYECRVAALDVPMVWLDGFYSVTRSHTEGHACSDGDTDPAKLADRCAARLRMLDHAISANVPPAGSELLRFFDSSFLLVRQAAAQQVPQAGSLLDGLLELHRSAKWRLYRALTRIAGPARAAACYQGLYDMLSRVRSAS